MITGSSISRAMHCIGSAVLPSIRNIESDAVSKGNAIHKFLCDCVLTDRDTALASVEDNEHYGICANIDVEDLLPVGTLHAELAMVFDLVTFGARILGEDLGRNYGELGPYDLAMTADLVVVNGGSVEVIDYKTGFSKKESAYESWQMRALCCACKQLFFCDTVKASVVHINDSGEFAFDSYTFDTDEMTRFALDLRKLFDDVAKADKANPSLSTGDHCRWCNSFNVCPAKRDLAMAFVGQAQAMLDRNNAAQVWIKAKQVEQIVDEVKKAIREMAEIEPIDLGNGKILTVVEKHRDKIDPLALDFLRAEIGDHALLSAKTTITKSGIDKSLLSWKKTQGLKTLPKGFKKILFEKMADQGLVGVSTFKTVDEIDA